MTQDHIGVTASSQPNVRQPNVIVFFTDQQRWDSTGVHGNPLGLTPNFDRLAREGTHLAQAVTVNPVCGPARAALQTGCYPTTTGCFRNNIPLPRDTQTIGHCFAEAGYTTGYIGKWHLGDPESHGPVGPEERGGYQEWLAANALELVSDAYRTVVYDNDNARVELPGYRVDALTEAAIRYVDRHRHDPFFLFLSLLEPHQQNSRDDYPAPDGYAERYVGRWTPPDLAALQGSAAQQLAGYWGTVARVDEALGRLRDAVKSLGLEDDTIILVTSDHGCHFKTRNSEYKRSCHEASVRIPTALTGSVFAGGRRVDHQVSTIDFAPTLLDAAGLDVPEVMEGRSVVPLVQGAGAPRPDEVLIQFGSTHVGRAVRTQRWKYAVTAQNGGLRPHAESYVEEFLYDLAGDPYELNNLAGLPSHRRVADVMRDRLHRLLDSAGEPTATIHAAPERPPYGQLRIDPAEAYE